MTKETRKAIRDAARAAANACIAKLEGKDIHPKNRGRAGPVVDNRRAPDRVVVSLEWRSYANPGVLREVATAEFEHGKVEWTEVKTTRS